MATIMETQVGTVPSSTAQDTPATEPRWALWQRVLFRFFFAYLVLQIAPWNWFGRIPGVGVILEPWSRLVNWAVHLSNDRVFHVRDTLVAVNG
ncbi:MAG: hypothetical protein ACREMA_06705, partial [Longimicrobiales bacterium]